MADSELYDVIIIGGGPAGLAAGLYARRAAMKTVLIERASFGGQVSITKGVENYLGIEEIGGYELAEKFLQHASSYDLEIVREDAEALEPGEEHHTVRLSNGTELRAHAVLLATGGVPRKLNVPGEKRFLGKGVSYCAKCDGLFFRDQTVVVVGGGDSATEESIYLAKIARHVHVVTNESSLRASKLLQQHLLNECNVSLYVSSTISEIKGDGAGVSSVMLRDVETGASRELPTDGIFIFIGLHPNNQLVPETIRKTPGGYVVTNEKRETSIPGIYVVGDLRRKYANQIVIAVADGCIGALAAAQYVEMRKEERRYCEMPTAA
ncbi:MAG: NAD(P)/FAD-dependent oxidoreductase [Acidobacteriota bacterium]